MIRIGQRLREARLHKGLSIEDVAQATKIRSSFLAAIERGEYQKLPSPTYAQGFVSNYAQYLGLPKREVMALFRREFDEDKIFQVLPDSFAHTAEFPLRRRKIQQTALVLGVIFIFLVGYLFFQYRYALMSPSLKVMSPQDGSVSSQDVSVTGKTDPSATVIVNNDLVSVDMNGNFSKKITVFPGKTTVVVTARNRFGKQTTVERTIEIKPGS